MEAKAHSPAMKNAEHKPEEMTGGHAAMMAEHHKMTLWVQPVLMVLGLWLLAGPATLGYLSSGMVWSDVISGLLVILCAAWGYAKASPWASWANCFIGIWLLFAPLIFWVPTPGAYLNDLLVGALLIAFSILIPHGMPMSGPDMPPGWAYNPSTWWQRIPIIALGFIGFFLARYMAAYQLDHIPTAWDPFFGDGTMVILKSEVSKAWPISDAGLGATAYLIEALMGAMGDPRRWRTMPWMVTFFGILVVPLGVVSIVLIIMQPLVIGTWCTLCLAAALAMLIMIPLTLDEVVAMSQFLAQSRREGKSLWSAFWLGGDMKGATEDRRSPEFGSLSSKIGPAMVWGMSIPWTLLAGTLLGIWLMLSPAVFGTESSAADSDHLVGALIITFAVIAMAEVTRALRFINGIFGFWLVAAPWFVGGGTTAAAWNDAIVGLALLLLSLPRGVVRERYGTWDRYVS